MSPNIAIKAFERIRLRMICLDNNVDEAYLHLKKKKPREKEEECKSRSGHEKQRLSIPGEELITGFSHEIFMLLYKDIFFFYPLCVCFSHFSVLPQKKERKKKKAK